MYNLKLAIQPILYKTKNNIIKNKIQFIVPISCSIVRYCQKKN
jgi:hypothetical protein